MPTLLIEKTERKYFPNCEACPVSNMAQQPMPGSILSNRELTPGEEIELDIKVYADNSSQRKHKRAIGGYTCALTAIDLATDYKFGYLLKNQQHLENTLEKLRLEIYSQHRNMKIIRLDNQFITEEITKWSQIHQITLLPCIPHEHHTIGGIERFNRSLEDGVVKLL